MNASMFMQSRYAIKQNNKAGIAVLAMLMALLLSACDSSEEDGVEDISTYLENAKSFQSSGQYQAAMIEARNAIQVAPDDTRGLLALANIYLEIGYIKQAIQLLEPNQSDNPDALLALAKAYLKAGKLRSASSLLEGKLKGLTGLDNEISLLRASVALAQNKLEEAESGFSTVLASDPASAEAMLGLATIEATEGDLLAVKDRLKNILEMQPDNTQALLFSSTLKSREGDVEGAGAQLLEALSSLPFTDIVTPLQYNILVALRDNLTIQGRSSEALIYSGLLAESMPGAQEIEAKFQKAIDAMGESNFEDARKLLEEIRAEAPGMDRAGTMLGVIEYLQGDNDAAVRQFEQFIDPETANPTAMQLFAMAELKLNQPGKVIERLSADIDSATDGKLVALYGIAAISSGDVDKGEKYLLKAVGLEPDNARLRFPLVQLYNRQGKNDAALEQIRAAFRAQPNDTVIQSALVQQLVTAGEDEAAAELITGIRSRNANSQESQLLVARYYLSQRKLDIAEEVLAKVLSLGESNIARLQIAGIHLSKQDFKKAESGFREIVELDPEYTDAYKGLVTVYELQGNAEDGLALVETLAQENGATNPVLVVSEYYMRNKEFKKAFAALAKLDEAESSQIAQTNQSIYLLKAEEQLRSNDIEGSRKTILEGLSAAPANMRLMALLVGVELQAGNVEEAKKVLERLKLTLPKAPIISILNGDILVADNDVAGALAHFQDAWLLAPSDQVAIKLYSSLVKTGIKGKELAAFVEEWNVKLPGSQIADITLSGYLMESGDLDSARKEYEALLEVNENIPIVHNNLAWIYGEEEIEKAVAAARRAYELSPKRAEVVDTFAWFLYKSGDVDRAKELIAEAVQLNSDNVEINAHFEEINAAP